jgi:rare lipoprotein A
MRAFFISAALLLGLGAGGSAAWAAEAFDARLQLGSARSHHHDQDATRSRRVRVARSTVSDEEDFDYYRSRRSRHADDADDDDRPRHWKRHTRAKGHRSQHHAVVKHQRMVAVKRNRRASVKHARSASREVRPQRTPTWTKRSLATQGPVGSGVTGVASYYWEHQRLASGGWFDPSAMTAAHKTLPFGTRVRVTHLGNGRSVDVRINDRGPYIAGRIIDLSKAAASLIGMTGQGVARVKMQILGR